MKACKRFVGLLSAVLLLCGSLPAAAEGERFEEAHVTFISGSSVYIDAGRAEGIREGDRIEILRDGEVVGGLTVAFVSTHRASGSIVEGSILPEVGDLVRFRFSPRAEPAPGTLGNESSSARRERGFLRAAGIRGRVGVRYLSLRDRMSGQSFTRPALDLWIDGSGIGGSPFDLSVDVRARRTSTTSSDGEDRDATLTRVYRLYASWHQREGGWGVSLGRQFAPALAVVSIFDGALADYSSRRWRVGAFSGTQPDPVDYGFSSTLRESGGFFQVHNTSGAPTRWSVTTGVVGSYVEGEINREFLYLQGLVHTRRLSVHLAQEIDYNRGWKELAEEQEIEPTSTFVSLSFRASQRIRLHGGYDNRRNIRLYRQFEDPETEFDDAFRRGAWAGVGFSTRRHYRVGVDARSSSGGTAGSADSYTLTLGARGFTRTQFGVRLRATRYENETSDGWLSTAGVEIAPARRVHLEIYGGTRNDRTELFSMTETDTQWYGAGIEVDLPKNLFLALSAERYDGDFEQSDQLYSSLSCRF